MRVDPDYGLGKTLSLGTYIHILPFTADCGAVVRLPTS
jgi:hypothetical protein